MTIAVSVDIAEQSASASGNKTSFIISDLLADWPYKPRLHPEFGTIDVESTNWTRLFGCLGFPLGPSAHGRLGCDLINLLFVIEEYTDFADPEAAARVCDVVMDVIRNPYKERNPANKFSISIQDFWKRALALVTPGSPCINRFIEEMDIYTKALVQEAEDRETKRVRTVADYLDLRRRTIGVQPSVAFISFDSDIPEEVCSHPAMKSIRQIGSDLIILANDMHSYAVEFARGIGFHNIVTSIMYESQLDLPTAMAQLQDLANERIQQFLVDKEDLPSWGEEVDVNVRKFIDGIGYLVRGNDAWSYETERYWGNRKQDVQDTKVGTLCPEYDGRDDFLTKEELEAAMVL